MTKRHFLLTPLLLGALLAGNLSAAPVQGSFSLNATINVTATTISWISELGIPDEFRLTLGTGDFDFATNSIHNIRTLSNLPGQQPVGPVAPPYPFIQFIGPTLSGDFVPDLWLDFVFGGTAGQSECLEPVNHLQSPSQTCTPFVGSPFTLTNVPTGMTASFSLSGVTSDLMSKWAGTWTSQFTGRSFQSVLDELSKKGSITNSVSADVLITVTPIPEPGTFALIGMGMIMATVAAKRLKNLKKKSEVSSL